MDSSLAQLQCCVKLSLSTNMIVNIQVSSIHIRKLLIVLNVDLVMIRFRKVVVEVIRQRVLYFSELAKSKVPQNPLTWTQSHQKSSWWSKSFFISISIRKLVTSTHPYLMQELRGSLIHWSSCGFHITGWIQKSSNARKLFSMYFYVFYVSLSS